MSDLKDRLRHWIDPRIFNVSLECAADIRAALRRIDELEADKITLQHTIEMLRAMLRAKNESGGTSQ